MKRNLIGKRLVGNLAVGMEMEGALKESGASIRGGARALRERTGREAVEARMLICETQTKLLAARFASHAIGALVGLIGNEKAEISLKAALAVLEMGRKEVKGKEKEKMEEVEGKREEVRGEEVDRIVGMLMGREEGMSD